MVDNNTIIVAVLTMLGALYGFYHKVKKNILDNEKSRNTPISELNKSIIELNSTIKHMNEDFKSLSNRVNEHGKQIDDLNVRFGELNTKVKIYHHE